jgi:SAM-dependent MidA family methyltransferase
MNAADKAVFNDTALAEALRERIRREGPITFRDWMEAALYNERGGYYCRGDRERWGREGDYRTSPERSPLFAATFARYFAKLYEELGSPARWTIVEAGAGAGQFAEKLLATLQRRFPKVFLATRYVIDEASADSRARAQTGLAGFGDRVEFRRLNDLDLIDPGIVFANELLDAFPVQRVTVRDGLLCEFYVGLGEAGVFEWSTAAPSTACIAEYLEAAGVRLAEGQIAEINLGIEDWMALVGAKLRNGYVVTIDYGAEAPELYGAPERRLGTLRAFHRHRLVDDVLARPGERDITTTVDWTCVKRIGEKLGFETVAFERQDRFLLSAGLLKELDLMVEAARDEAEKSQLRTSAREMILPSGMATSFQVLVQKSSSISPWKSPKG